MDHWPKKRKGLSDPLQVRLCDWQQARTWARLIREAESLWHVEARELRRIGELELSQLLQEVPPRQRPRVNRWLKGYGDPRKFGIDPLVWIEMIPYSETRNYVKRVLSNVSLLIATASYWLTLLFVVCHSHIY